MSKDQQEIAELKDRLSVIEKDRKEKEVIISQTLTMFGTEEDKKVIMDRLLNPVRTTKLRYREVRPEVTEWKEIEVNDN